mmetsp:Transcript_15313/g.36051  ORF Transcript_15313/g.36051 Transcript_15313/m.36051 type:complete len:220 (+) Transcript_15313:1646-2305(+)
MACIQALLQAAPPGRALQAFHELIIVVAQVDGTDRGADFVVHERPPLLRQRSLHESLVGAGSTSHQRLFVRAGVQERLALLVQGLEALVHMVLPVVCTAKMWRHEQLNFRQERMQGAHKIPDHCMQDRIHYMRHFNIERQLERLAAHGCIQKGLAVLVAQQRGQLELQLTPLLVKLCPELPLRSSHQLLILLLGVLQALLQEGQVLIHLLRTFLPQLLE